MSEQKIKFTVISLHFPCTLTEYICSVLRHYFPYWALDCCCSNIKLDGCDIASFNQRWLVSDQKVTDFSNFPQAQNTMWMKYFVLYWFEIKETKGRSSGQTPFTIITKLTKPRWI